jgi:peptide/nickel transport system permease protein
MIQYIARRLLYLIPVLLAMSVLIFSMVHLAPGDPVLVMLNSSERASVSPEMIAAVTAELGLDQPLFRQYLNFLWGILHGDMGTSYQLRKPVLEVVSNRIWPTVQLTLTSITISLLLSIPLGIISAMRRGSLVDNFTMAFAVIGVSTPNFWFGLMAILLFAVKLGWLPSFGIGYASEGIGSIVSHLLLPGFTLGLSLMAIVTRMTRSSLLEVLGLDYIQTARAKGLAEPIVLRKHALRSALIPVITVVGLQFGALMGGAVIVETIFAWPGIGRLMITAIQRRDFPLVQGLTLIFTFGFVLVNLAVDVAYSFLDPRIRYK